MALNEDLQELIAELDRFHGGNIYDHGALARDFDFPDFVTAENGLQRHFTKKARIALRYVSQTIFDNSREIAALIAFENFVCVVRQCVADMHAAGCFPVGWADGDAQVKAQLVTEIKSRVAMMVKEYTHYFPAWTLGMEAEAPFSLGPVTLFTRQQWLDGVDFSDWAKDNFLMECDANHRWKQILKDALAQPSDSTPLTGLAGPVYGAIFRCPSIVKITVKGYEQNFSRRLAQMICKTALDAISLTIGGEELFHQQALGDERLEPVGSDHLMETDGYLWLPGTSLGKRVRHLSYDQVRDAVNESDEVLKAVEPILAALVDPSSHRHPKLAQRWATALDWFGEGNREKSDAVALAKIGTSLDVLSCGGKYAGILELITNLTGAPHDKEVISGRKPKKLSQLVKDIYDNGRSKILHGTHYDRLLPFAEDRHRAAFLTRIALLESATRLKKYPGDDIDTAFRTMLGR